MYQAHAVLPTGDSEEVYPGLFCERHSESQVVVYRVMTVSNAMLEAWAGWVAATLETWPVECPYLALHDLSKTGISLQFATLVSFDLANIGITLRGQVRAHHLMAARGLRARVALNFSLSVSGHVNKVLAENQTRLYRQHDVPPVDYKTFYNEATALTWLARPPAPIDVTHPIELRVEHDR